MLPARMIDQVRCPVSEIGLGRTVDASQHDASCGVAQEKVIVARSSRRLSASSSQPDPTNEHVSSQRSSGV